MNIIDIQYQPCGNREITWQDFFGEGNLRSIETILKLFVASGWIILVIVHRI
ncbi:MAG: hypothetical protein WBA93_31450 [Microcoleaceae cyanobacterium]